VVALSGVQRRFQFTKQRVHLFRLEYRPAGRLLALKNAIDMTATRR